VRFWLYTIGSLLLACMTQAQAHERSESTSHWSLSGDGALYGVITTRTREVTRLTIPGDSYASLAQIFAAHVERSVAASVDGTPCTKHEAPTLLESEPGFLRVAVWMQCRPGERLTLQLTLFQTVAPSHRHFLYVESGRASREAILSASAPTTELELHTPGSSKTSFIQFVKMGIEHIATGFDHLAFLLALLISARTVRQGLAIITGFTLGHSLTLSLAVLGVVQANSGAVECAIGATIALAAAQNLIRGEREGRIGALAALAICTSLLLVPGDLRPALSPATIAGFAFTTASAIWLGSLSRQSSLSRQNSGQTSFSPPARFAIAAGFGLIHGLGFASALQELQLPRALLLQSLLGFNVGVEVGQLALVIAAVGLIRVAATIVPELHRRAEASAAVASAAALAAGVTWFLTRAIF
jgi:hypothetical protein